MDPLMLNGQPLSIDDVVHVARAGRRVMPGSLAIENMRAARELVERLSGGDQAFYGINTGFGPLSTVRIPAEQLTALQHNLVRSHAAGVGEPFPVEIVRATMLLLAASLARGHSGVRPLLVERLCILLNAGIHPLVPSRGSVGASGDLAPLAHVALALIGEGRVMSNGTHPIRSTGEVLAEAGLVPLELEEKEGLALINGTHVMAGSGALLIADAEWLLGWAEAAAALSLEAARGTAAPLDARIHAVRPQLGQAAVAARMRELTDGSEILNSHPDCGRVQDPYSLRCVPQVLGAAADGIAFARSLIERELGAVTDNPLCFAEGGVVISGGNFHGQPLALALDVLGIVLAQIAGMAERRIYLLVSASDPAMQLPVCLTRGAGLQSGMMIAQYAAAALVCECQALATPASIRSIPTGAGMEDFVSMGATAALQAAQILVHTRRVIAIELMCAAQGLEFHRPLQAGAGVERIYAHVRSIIPTLEDDRPLSDDIAAIEAMLSAAG